MIYLKFPFNCFFYRLHNFYLHYGETVSKFVLIADLVIMSIGVFRLIGVIKDRYVGFILMVSGDGTDLF